MTFCRPPGLQSFSIGYPALTHRATTLPPLNRGSEFRSPVASLTSVPHTTGAFFTICRRQILHHAQRAFFTTAQLFFTISHRQILKINGNSKPPTVPPAYAGSIFFYSLYEWLRLRLRLRLHRLALYCIFLVNCSCSMYNRAQRRRCKRLATICT